MDTSAPMVFSVSNSSNKSLKKFGNPWLRLSDTQRHSSVPTSKKPYWKVLNTNWPLQDLLGCLEMDSDYNMD